MNYYNTVQTIKTFFIDRGIIKTFVESTDDRLDLDKIKEYPLAHMVVDDIDLNIDSTTNVYNVRIIISKPLQQFATADEFGDNTNRMTVLNSLLIAAEEFVLSAKYGSLSEQIEFVEGSFSAVPFTEQFENLLTGYVLSVSIRIPRTATIC